MTGRVICTLLLFGVLYVINGMLSVADPIIAGQSAAQQFQPSNWSYFQAHAGMHVVGWVRAVFDIIVFAMLAGIWWSTGRHAIERIKAELNPPQRGPGTGPLVCLFCIPLFAIVFLSSHAQAYYSKTNYTEVMVVLPNQSAFLIPDVGDNASGQAQLQSADYLNSKRVPFKRVEIPHVQLPGSGWFANYWVPAARLILVNRQPYYREWTWRNDKGTSTKDEGFECESSEGIDIKTAITISASITELDAHKYLYYFGVTPPFSNNSKLATGADMTEEDGRAIFTSVMFARDLTNVMDTVVHGAVKAALCNAMGARPLTKVFPEKRQIITEVFEEVKKEYSDKGITIEYIGFAAPLDPDAAVQKSIDEVYIASQKAASTLALKDAIPVMHEQANIGIKDAIAKTIESKGLPPVTLPSFLWLPQSWLDAIGSWFNYTPAQAGVTRNKTQ